MALREQVLGIPVVPLAPFLSHGRSIRPPHASQA